MNLLLHPSALDRARTAARAAAMAAMPLLLGGCLVSDAPVFGPDKTTLDLVPSGYYRSCPELQGACPANEVVLVVVDLRTSDYVVQTASDGKIALVRLTAMANGRYAYEQRDATDSAKPETSSRSIFGTVEFSNSQPTVIAFRPAACDRQEGRVREWFVQNGISVEGSNPWCMFKRLSRASALELIERSGRYAAGNRYLTRLGDEEGRRAFEARSKAPR